MNSQRQTASLAACVTRALDDYFRDLDGEAPDNIYEMVMRSVEAPMIAYVMAKANNNQTRAAELLGINRNTLRKKLAEYQLPH
ncbi:MAG: Fis family transcriptional regulator [Zoogloeaceae bacterium]|jgi:Fis family transcriptional regulator|nr:Fis family transcriptional regulator [Zoogloeaceae bacterium]